MHFDVLFLSRLQFALTLTFHYLFPPLSIGLSALLVIMEGMYLITKKPIYEDMARFWTRVFAVNFSMGVATGIPMEFQFGTNWAHYSRFVGDVFGSALASEGIFAFFLESGFLAVLVFGWDRVSPKVHFFSTAMVAFGSFFSAVWIVVANSWMQTPRGFHIVGTGDRARAQITDFWAMVWNPSSLDRLLHTLLGAYALGAFFVLSISAFYILKGRHLPFAKKSFAVALIFGTFAAVLQLVSGDLNGKMVARYQPAKLAAMEGHYHTGVGGTRLSLFGIPDPAHQRLLYTVAIPKLLSVLVYHNPNTPVQGLDKTPVTDRPPVVLPFITYHVMVALGTFMIALTCLGLVLLRKERIFRQRWLLWVFVVSVAAPYIANECGWISAEVGRQPWVVYGILRTSQGVSQGLHGDQVFGSIFLFMFTYALLFCVWLYIMSSKIHHGPDHHDVLTPSNSAQGFFATHIMAEDPAGLSFTDSGNSDDAESPENKER